MRAVTDHLSARGDPTWESGAHRHAIRAPAYVQNDCNLDSNAQFYAHNAPFRDMQEHICTMSGALRGAMEGIFPSVGQFSRMEGKLFRLEGPLRATNG